MPESAERAIGRLEGKVDTLLNSMETNQQKSEQGRSRIYQDLEQIRHDAARDRADAAQDRAAIRTLSERLEVTEKSAREMEDLRNKAAGVVGTFGVLGVLLGGAGALFWQWISKKIGLG